MPGFYQQMGMYSWPLFLIALSIGVLTALSVWRLVRNEPADRERTAYGINAILFWGGLAAVVGILGQFQGIYEALNAIAVAAEVSPQVVWRGLAVSFTTTLAGLATLVVAALIWVSLQAVYRRSGRLSSTAA